MEGGAALTLEEGDGPTDLDHHGCQHHRITTTIVAASASSPSALPLDPIFTSDASDEGMRIVFHPQLRPPQRHTTPYTHPPTYLH
jgi:hypothetical protein